MIKRIFSYSGQYKKYLVFAALCITAESLFELVIPLIMANIVDIGVASGNRAYIFEQGAWMLVCAFLALLLGIGSAKFSAVAGQGLGANLRKAEYAKLQQFSFANVDHFQISSLVTRMTSDVTNIQNSISGGMRPACRGPVMLVAATNMAAMQFVMYGTILSILWFGGRMIRIGGMRVGELTGFLSYVLQILNSLMMISNIFMMLTRSLASGKRILEVLDEEMFNLERGNRKNFLMSGLDNAYKEASMFTLLSEGCV